MQTLQGAIVNKPLTNISNGYFPMDFIAEQVLPAFPVFQTSGLVMGYTNNHLRIVNTVHTGKGNYRQLESVVTNSQTYSIEDHGLYDIITENQMRNFEKPFDAKIDTTLALTLAQAIAKEYGLASTLTNPSVVTQGVTLSGNSQYNNIRHADSDPIADKLAADAAIRAATGRNSNTAIMSADVFSYLSRHTTVLQALGYTTLPPMGVSKQQLATILQVDNVLVCGAQYNSAKEGQADSMVNIWGKDLIYALILPPALRQKTLGYEMRKSGTSPRQVYTYTPPMPVNSMGVIVTDNYDQIILDATCAYLIQDAIA